jgi:predicted transcriptional regulator
MDEEANLIALTANIVSAHVSNNRVPVSDVASLVQQVHSALARLSRPVAVRPPELKVGIVSIKASIKPGYIVCMECGKKQSLIKRHLATAHGMTPDQYRNDYGLPLDYPMVAPDYAAKRSKLAKASGLGRKKAEPAKKKRSRLGIVSPPTSGD